MESNLKIKISADLDELKKGLSDADRQVSGFSSKAAGSAGKLASSLDNASASSIDLSNATEMSAAQLAAWDAAARRNQLEQYDANIRKTTKDVKELATAQQQLGSASNKLGSDIKGTNTVAIEFSRIIQDAPYGVVGVGNNITQLTQNFANLQRQTGSTSKALKVAFSSLFQGTNLLVLGISAVTTAFTLYSMWARKASKETKELDDGTKRYIETLEGVARAQADGAVAAQKDLAQLRLLYQATQNQTLSMEDRKKAADELIRQYPKQFEGLSQEAILAGEAAGAYDRLSKSLVATARASAVYSKVADNQAKILDKQLRIADLAAEQTRLQAQRDAQQAAAIRAQQQATGLASGSLEAGLARRAQKQVEETQKRIQEGQLEIAKLTTENNDLQEYYNKLIGEGADLSGRLATGLGKAGAKAKEAADYTSQIVDILHSSDSSKGLLGLSGIDLGTERIRQKYEVLYTGLSKIEQKIRNDAKLTEEQKTQFLEESAKVRIQLGINEAAENSQNEIDYAKKTQDTIVGIRSRAGIRSLEDDLQRIQSYYDEQRRIHAANIEVINALNEAQRQEETNARRKWQADLMTIDIETTRRANETRSQMMIRQLNNEVRAWKAAAQEKLKAMVDAGEDETKIRQTQANEQAKIQERYWKRIMQIQKFQQLEEMADSFAGAMSNAFEDSLLRGANLFKSLGDEFKSMLVRMAADALRAQIGKAIMSGISSSSGGKGGGFWGFLGGLFRFGSNFFKGSGYSSGSFPTGNYGGGNFPATNPIKGGGFVPGIQSSSKPLNINVTGVMRGQDIMMTNSRATKFNDRFNGGQ